MALTKCDVPTDVIGSLGTTPEERGLTTQEFKDKFDQMPEGIKDYLNNTLTAEIDSHLADYNFSVTSTDVDGKPIQTQYKRQDDTLYLQVDATNPDANGNYQTIIEKYYDLNGTTLLKTVTWTITYNADGLIIARSWVVA